MKGLMLHSVGCPQPRASAFVRSWDSPAHGGSCVHGFIDGEDGTVYQTLPWNHRGWHCGSGNRGSGNNTHIGVEMCESACIRYTAGSNFTCLDVDAARAVAERTYRAAVGLFAMLCGKYGLDPLEDGVVISHREGCARGIASNHGDPEHLWGQLGMGYTMDGFRREVRAAMEGAASGVDGCMRIMGKAVATAGQMAAYVRARNPGVVQSVLDMIPLYLSEGEAEGVRGDIAFAQSCLETGNFTFSGSAVTLLQNNFCGMGGDGEGNEGEFLWYAAAGDPGAGAASESLCFQEGVGEGVRGSPVPVCGEGMRGVCGVAGAEGEPGREGMGCGGRVWGEDSCHPGGHPGNGRRGAFRRWCWGLVPRPEVLDGCRLAERGF